MASESDPLPDDAPSPAAEQFAVAVDGPAGSDAPRQGRDGTVDPALARELEIVNLLAAQGSAFDPEPQVRARARARLLAALQEEALQEEVPREEVPREEAPRSAEGEPPRAS